MSVLILTKNNTVADMVCNSMNDNKILYYKCKDKKDLHSRVNDLVTSVIVQPESVSNLPATLRFITNRNPNATIIIYTNSRYLINMFDVQLSEYNNLFVFLSDKNMNIDSIIHEVKSSMGVGEDNGY